MSGLRAGDDEPGLDARQRKALTAAEFTFGCVAEVRGTTGHAALPRKETLPGPSATGGGTPVDTLIRLWLPQAPVRASNSTWSRPTLRS